MLTDLGYEVVGLTRRINHLLPINQIEFDFTRIETWENPNLSQPFDFIFHGASHGPMTANPDFYLINHILPIKFFSRITFNQNCKFIFASSASVYGNTPVDTITEFCEPAPTSDYAISKILFERSMPDVLKNNGSLGNFVALRIPTLLGAKVSKNLIGRWIDSAVNKTPIRVSNPELGFTSLIGELEILKWTATHIGTLLPKKYVINCYTNGDLSYYASAKLVSEYFGGKEPEIIQNIGLGALKLNNRDDPWFDKISTEKTILSHIQKMNKSLI
jgi:nucleoside-diphosphate-sugar epimerase